MKSAIQGWFKSICSCDIKLQQLNCLDSTTVSIITVFQSDEDNTAQAMIDKIVNYIQEQNYSVVYLDYEWGVCLDSDCKWKHVSNNNSTTAVEEPNKNDFILKLVGLTVGAVLCVVVASLLCIFIIIGKMCRYSYIK